jgi:branched-chain amino acid transport system ATP-binding protein
VALLELDNVVASYGAIEVLHGISLAVEEGSVVAMLGANGAGKTTTLRAISGRVKLFGSIRFDGRTISGKAAEEVARMGIAHVPEGRGTLAQLTVLENLQMGSCLRRDRAGIKKDMELVYGYFPWMPKRQTQTAALLSGGEQQMLAIARALMMRPRLLLLDEPSLGLAPTVLRAIFEIIARINKDEGMTILVVEQNARTALRVADRAHVLEVGQIAVSGTGAELAENESVRRSYLGY